MIETLDAPVKTVAPKSDVEVKTPRMWQVIVVTNGPFCSDKLRRVLYKVFPTLSMGDTNRALRELEAAGRTHVTSQLTRDVATTLALQANEYHMELTGNCQCSASQNVRFGAEEA